MGESVNESLNGCIDAVNRSVAEIKLLTAFVGSFCESIKLDPILKILPNLASHVYKNVDSGEAEEMRVALSAGVENIRRLSNVGGDDAIPYVLGLAVIKLCTIVDDLVDSVLVSLLMDASRWGVIEGLAKLKLSKVSLIEYLAASQAQQASLLADEFRSSQSASLKVGIGKYECVLAPAGLGGSVHRTVAKRLLELNEVRNIFVHRRGFPDKRFFERCPWKGLETGKQLTLNINDVIAMSFAALWYACELGERSYSLYGVGGGGLKSDVATVKAEVFSELAALDALD